jgi:hypothetical protein
VHSRQVRGSSNLTRPTSLRPPPRPIRRPPCQHTWDRPSATSSPIRIGRGLSRPPWAATRCTRRCLNRRTKPRRIPCLPERCPAIRTHLRPTHPRGGLPCITSGPCPRRSTPPADQPQWAPDYRACTMDLPSIMVISGSIIITFPLHRPPHSRANRRIGTCVKRATRRFLDRPACGSTATLTREKNRSNVPTPDVGKRSACGVT